ncbi:unnamed protein product [Miscanthus lutarioriparius]|uniref:Uncharacterized protein n=1 Tax=Miscanthus lutarioriparius TaxID=422564 RepID=A0A811SK55_9POAL|nr:unnamed protein product [Miscanthus lutarioriparius]
MASAPASTSPQEELLPHPVKEQLPGVSYMLTSPPPWLMAIVLGFQHYLVMLGTTVIIPTALVPQMGGGNHEKARVIQTLLFVAGINTLLQTLWGTRLPTVIGGSYAFVAPTISVIVAGRYNGITDPHEKFVHIMRGTQGALIASSALQIVLGFSGLWRIIVRQLSPLSAAPLVALVGFGLYEHGFASAAKCIWIGLPEIVLLVALSQVQAINYYIRRIPVITSVAVVWLYAFFLTIGGAYKNAGPETQSHCRTDRSGLVGAAPWISIPYPFQWGVPTFHAREAFAMTAASFVALVESTGAFIASARFAGATPCPPSVMSRGVGWQGIGILLGGLLGTANGSSASVENAGLLVLTRIGSRRVVQISAGFMILFSIFGKFGAFFASIPGPIFAAIYCLLFAYVGTGGITCLQFCNLNSFRTKFILGFSMFMGLSVPKYLKDYNLAGHGSLNPWVTDMIEAVFSSEAFVGGVVAYFLDNTLNRNDRTIRKDRGQHFWDRFKSYKTDPRSEEFYTPATSIRCLQERFPLY